MMKEKTKEIAALRNRVFLVKNYLARVTTLSWRVKKIEEKYNLDSDTVAELESLLIEYLGVVRELRNVSRDIDDIGGTGK